MPDANPRHIVDERLDDPASYLTCPEATGYLGDLPTNFPHNDAKSSAQPTGPAHGIEQLPRVRRRCKTPPPMPPKKGTRPWIPIPMPWEGARLSDDGMRLRLLHISGLLPDRADVRWEPQRLTATLSRMGAPTQIQKLGVHYRCVELRLSRDASGLILIDGTTGERATAKRSRWLDPEHLQETETTLAEVFEPSEFLIPREVGS